jgi:hypothetical protein
MRIHCDDASCRSARLVCARIIIVIHHRQNPAETFCKQTGDKDTSTHTGSLQTTIMLQFNDGRCSVL